VSATERAAQLPAPAASPRPVPSERRVPAHRRYRIHAPRRWYHVRLSELWTYRRLVRHFGWAFVTRKFSGMWLGWLWLPLRPSIQLFQRGLVFGTMLHVGSGNRPYLIFLLVGQAAWDFFDRSAYWSLRALRIHRQVQQVQVPWMTATMSTLVAGAVDAAFYVVVLAGSAVYYKLTQGSFYLAFGPASIEVVVGIALLAVWACTVGFFVAPLVYKIPDGRYLLRYFFQFLVYLTPVIYPTSSLQGAQALATYNPLTAPIELIKDGLLGTGRPAVGSTMACMVGLGVLLPLGLLLLARAERSAHRSL
jgi:lipopolysaccharide transport system permease protein